jgi:hypothetical protein
MKIPIRLQTLIAAAALAGAPLLAAPERLNVPLSDPAKPARLEVSLVMGSIEVVAGKAGVVVIDADAAPGDGDHEHDEDWEPAIAGRAEDKPEKGKSRLRRIPNDAYELSAEERANKVTVSTDSWARAVDLRIEVPADSAVVLSTVNDGDLLVSGLSGELELHNTNGEITVRDARGPVSANTVNGDVTIVFGRAVAAAPMAFSTLNGDVDLTLPADARFDVRLKSENGDIYSDFDVELARKAPKVEEERGKGRYRVSITKELAGKIGGGGPEIFLKTFNGDIVLRRRDG